jgi:hypothetical protein
MAEERMDAVASPDTIRVRSDVPPVRLVMRNYFSTYLLWGSREFARTAAAIEAKHTGKSRFDIEHRAYVLSALANAAAFLEAMVNELFQDAADGYGITGDGYIAPLTGRTRERMREWWIASGEGYERVLDKFQLLLAFAEREELDRGGRPFQDASLLVGLRNAVMHFRPESVAADLDHRFTKSLKGRFADNALMSGSGNPWWPDHALGAGCAQWAYASAKALADTVTDMIGVAPNYRRHEATWFSSS